MRVYFVTRYLEEKGLSQQLLDLAVEMYRYVEWHGNTDLDVYKDVPNSKLAAFYVADALKILAQIEQ